MERLGDTQPHRGIEFGVHEIKPGEWQWDYYPKIGEGTHEWGIVKGTRGAAISACKAAIDKWLGPDWRRPNDIDPTAGYQRNT